MSGMQFEGLWELQKQKVLNEKITIHFPEDFLFNRAKWSLKTQVAYNTRWPSERNEAIH